jgi:hypothetical protein
MFNSLTAAKHPPVRVVLDTFYFSACQKSPDERRNKLVYLLNNIWCVLIGLQKICDLTLVI